MTEASTFPAAKRIVGGVAAALGLIAALAGSAAHAAWPAEHQAPRPPAPW